jgi:SAM-dependent methyltransferase
MTDDRVMMRSASSNPTVSLWDKLIYDAKLLQRRLKTSDRRTLAREVLDEARRTAAVYEHETGRPARDASVLEIGFGPRPYRAYAMALLFGSVAAIDLDEPALRLADVPAVLRRNGAERALKTLVRLALFDLREIPRVRAELARLAGVRRAADPSLQQADAADPAFWADKSRSLDLVVSDDVFEHIPPENLPAILRHMHHALKPDGVAIIRPFIFNGVSGGHDIEAYPENLPRLRAAEAWRHLWDPEFTVNTYLNRLSRREFRQLFEPRFRVVADESLMPQLGRDMMTSQLRSRLKTFDDYELFSNKVEFVLRPRPI